MSGHRLPGPLARSSASGASPRPALFLIGHGTRSSKGNDQFEELAAALAAARPGTPVGRGFIEQVEPGLDLAMDGLVAGGVTDVVAVPLTLFGAGHLKDDGPVALASARSRHPRLHTSYARELGVHPSLLSLATDRIRKASNEEPDAVVVVGRGSTDPDANADLAKMVRLLADSRGLGLGLGASTDLTAAGEAGGNRLGLVEPAFVSLAAPHVAAALERVHRLGARRITVLPYFLFHGVLVDRLRDQARTWAGQRPGAVLSFGNELGPDGRLVALVWERYDEALGHGVLMNCDCCIHRAPLPGYEKRVGERPGA